ncbi:hypothetical protein [Helicobacter mesocricetorum]|uniref:hypothetical protein n=1 Tax=Helicobacter mesocricetorum TaxID=87012 RepID=UPI001F3B1754|nr:hypothetical protein [Helicobacter mesocricetorum]
MKILLIGLIFVISIAGYFFLSPSYALSRKAQKAYNQQDFQKAYEFSAQALEKDIYNKSAFQIHSLSKQRINIQNFLEKTKQNFENALTLLQKPKLSPQEFLELQWIYDDFSAHYKNLFFTNKPTEEEKQTIEEYFDWFKQLKNKLLEAKEKINATKDSRPL